RRTYLDDDNFAEPGEKSSSLPSLPSFGAEDWKMVTKTDHEPIYDGYHIDKDKGALEKCNGSSISFDVSPFTVPNSAASSKSFASELKRIEERLALARKVPIDDIVSLHHRDSVSSRFKNEERRKNRN